MPGGDDEISLGAIRPPQAPQSATQGEFFALRAGRVGDRDPKMLRHWSQDYTDVELEREGLDALEAPDRDKWICFAGCGTWLPVVAKNREELQRRGTFERALVQAWYGNEGTTYEWDPAWIEKLFLVHANRERLRAEGDALPAGKIFRVYRGVGGLGECRRENGLAWTIDRVVAERFASCAVEPLKLADCLVLEGRVLREDVLTYVNWREESEMICSKVEIVARHAVAEQ